MSIAATDALIPVHQFTHTGNRVLLVKCVERGGKSHGGFQWPKSGEVTSANWSPEPTCESGGLFGWAWGLNLGGGKNPGYQADWIVFAASPESVVDLDDKQKAGPTAEVVYYGAWAGALEFTRAGREAWLETMFAAARERAGKARKEHAKAKRGAASATGESGAASATGESGAASATGERGAASATGWRGAASATGGSGAASATGWSGAASATGERGAASATGLGGAASATGGSGAASATGWRGAASATGWMGAASATGGSGAAAITGPYSLIEIGPRDAGVVTADEFTWLVHLGAVVLHRWEDGHALLTTDGLAEGAVVSVSKGAVIQ